MPDGPGPPATSTACRSGASSPCAACPIADRHFISKASHPAKSKGPGITPRKMLPERRRSSHPIGCRRTLPGELAAEGGGAQAGARPAKAAGIRGMVTRAALGRLEAMKKSSTLGPKPCTEGGGDTPHAETTTDPPQKIVQLEWGGEINAPKLPLKLTAMKKIQCTVS